MLDQQTEIKLSPNSTDFIPPASNCLVFPAQPGPLFLRLYGISNRKCAESGGGGADPEGQIRVRECSV